MANHTKIKVADTVMVNAGKNKGIKGKVLAIDIQKQRILIEGINEVKKHMKGDSQRPGEIKTINRPIHLSNVQLFCAVTKKRTRIGYKVESGIKQRISKKSQAPVPEVEFKKNK